MGETLRGCLHGMLALDDKSRTGYLVGVAYFVRAVHDEAMRAHAQEGILRLRAFLADQLRRARDTGEGEGEGTGDGEGWAGRAPDEEAMRLICLVEGLNTYLTLGIHTPDEAARLLDRQLAELLPPSALQQD